MTLGEIVREYREEHGLSQRQFAVACDLSNGYISMLEKNVNPKTGQPMAPSLLAIKKIADVMHISLNDLLAQADDMPVGVFDDAEEENETPTVDMGGGRTKEFYELFELLPAEKQALVIREIKGLLSEK